ncbi:MAG TPA: hypothetical protein VMS17_24955 [Gemmataceae bacterium]|nr:hypothetical protein [Gemmataceae bacterium]
MLPEGREARLRCYRNALRNWKYAGYVQFDLLAVRELETILPEYSLSEIAHEMHNYVEAGGRIDEQEEKRALECATDKAEKWRYDLRLTINQRRIYFESVLLCKDPDDPDDPMIQVVNAKDA